MSAPLITLWVTGKPIAWQRPGTFNGKHYTPAETKAWEARIAEEARALLHRGGRSWRPSTKPISLSIAFYLRIPPSWSHRKRHAAANGEIAPTSTPDLDNLVKAIKDALNGVVWVDDAQVVELEATKAYGGLDVGHGVSIKAHELSSNAASEPA